jgi:hypothetical protein
MRSSPIRALVSVAAGGVIALSAARGLAGGASERVIDPTPAWVAQRVREWQPTARERRWEAIGWAKDLRDAQRLARTARRPVFLFTHDGRLSVGRC